MSPLYTQPRVVLGAGSKRGRSPRRLLLRLVCCGCGAHERPHYSGALEESESLDLAVELVNEVLFKEALAHDARAGIEPLGKRIWGPRFELLRIAKEEDLAPELRITDEACNKLL